MREPDQRFTAPWGPLLFAMSALFDIVLVAVVFTAFIVPPEGDETLWYAVMVGPPIAGMMIAPLFMIRGYVLRGDTLVVERLGWATTIPLATLVDATADTEATRGSWRTFGNGGAFSFTGWYRSKTLGTYRMFGTDMKRSVVLRFSDRKPIVVTPGDPAAFTQAVRAIRDRTIGAPPT